MPTGSWQAPWETPDSKDCRNIARPHVQNYGGEADGVRATKKVMAQNLARSACITRSARRRRETDDDAMIEVVEVDDVNASDVRVRSLCYHQRRGSTPRGVASVCVNDKPKTHSEKIIMESQMAMNNEDSNAVIIKSGQLCWISLQNGDDY